MLLATQLLVVTALVAGPEAGPEAGPDVQPTPTDEPAPTNDASDRFDLALIRTHGLDADVLQAELKLRTPEIELRPHADAGDLSQHTSAYLYLETRAKTPSLYQIAVIVSDGRAYYGEVAADEGLRPERVVASTLANLIFSIEQGTVTPDRQDATIPPSEAIQPEPDEPTENDATPDAVTAAPARPKLEIAVTPGLGYALGLGTPHHGDVYLGFGGGAGVELRTATGFHAFADFRTLGRSAGTYRITRLRAALGAGFAWRPPAGHFELVTDLALAVEPWLVSSTDGPAPITREDGTAGRPPLLSALLRLSPGYRITFDRGTIKGLRIGPRIDVAAGFVPAPSPKIALIDMPDGTPAFRLGGAELMTGVELAIWMGPK